MQKKLRVFLTGHAPAELNELAILLSTLSGIECHSQLANPRYDDPLYGVSDLPDVLILHLSDSAETILKALSQRPAHYRPITLIVGLGVDKPQLMRLAMQAGARDFYSYPLVAQEITQTLRQIAKEKTSQNSKASQLTAVINAKNSSGGSMLAANLAHIMALRGNASVALVDMDLQFGSQLFNFNLQAQFGIFEALNQIQQLDIVALKTFLTPYKPNLQLLCALPEQVALLGEVNTEALSLLFDKLRQGYDYLLVDVPRFIDANMTLILEQAEQIILCVQQNVLTLRDAQRLLKIIRQDMEIPSERISLVINRYQAGNAIQLSDIKKTLEINTLYCIPNDYQRVSHAINSGVPLLESAPTAAITHSLIELASALSGMSLLEQKSLLNRFLSRLSH